MFALPFLRWAAFAKENELISQIHQKTYMGPTYILYLI